MSPTSRAWDRRRSKDQISTGFYWDQNDGTRAFAKRFQEKHPSKMMPNDMHAGMYSATLHLLKAMAVIRNASDGVKLVDQMKAIPTEDALFGRGSSASTAATCTTCICCRPRPSRSPKGPWDIFNVLATIKPEDAWRPLEKGGCPWAKA